MPLEWDFAANAAPILVGALFAGGLAAIPLLARRDPARGRLLPYAALAAAALVASWTVAVLGNNLILFDLGHAVALALLLGLGLVLPVLAVPLAVEPRPARFVHLGFALAGVAALALVHYAWPP